MGAEGFRVLGTQDDLAEGHIGIVQEIILWWPIVCTPYEQRKVGPVTVTVDQVCIP